MEPHFITPGIPSDLFALKARVYLMVLRDHIDLGGTMLDVEVSNIISRLYPQPYPNFTNP